MYICVHVYSLPLHPCSCSLLFTDMDGLHVRVRVIVGIPQHVMCSCNIECQEISSARKLITDPKDDTSGRKLIPDRALRSAIALSRTADTS
jgi:hypothetical protein